MMDLHVIPECYIDTKLCKILVPPTGGYNHQKGCSQVVKIMKEKLYNDFALGIVDKDKRELPYYSEFALVAQSREDLKLFKHRARNHYLIFICPAMEKWIISCANESKVSLESFGLKHDFQELCKITKTMKSENEDPFSNNFRELFKELKKSNSYFVATLTFWIEYLKNNPYSANLEHIRLETGRILEERQ